MSIQDLVKEIVRESVSSFATTNNGEGLCDVKANLPEPLYPKLNEFRSGYLAYYGLDRKDIEDFPPFCLMFHVLGITDTLRNWKEFSNEQFLDYLLKLYRLSGVTEIKKDT